MNYCAECGKVGAVRKTRIESLTCLPLLCTSLLASTPLRSFPSPFLARYAPHGVRSIPLVGCALACFESDGSNYLHTMKNDTVFNAILAIGLSTRQALDYASRHFGKQVVTGYMKGGGTVTAPEGADAERVKEFNKLHLTALRLASTMANAARVTFGAFCSELEQVRIAELERVKAEAEVKEAAKAGAKKLASATPPVAKAA